MTPCKRIASVMTVSLLAVASAVPFAGAADEKKADAHRERSVTQDDFSKQAAEEPGDPIGRTQSVSAQDAATLQPKDAKVPPPATGGVGPLIAEFARVSSACPFPDPKSRILKYRVQPIADGSTVSRIQIVRDLSTGESGLAWASPGFGSTSLQLQSDAGVPDVAPNARTRAFTLQATDNRGRSVSRRLPFEYQNSSALRPHIKLLPIDIAHDRSRGDYVYSLPFAFREINIQSLSVTLRGQDASQAVRAEFADLRPQLRGGSLPTGSSSSSREMTATVRAPADIRTNRAWSVKLTVHIAPYGSCSSNALMPALVLTEGGTGGSSSSSTPPRIGSSGSCEGEGDACTVRPVECSGRETGFTVPGRKVCERGRAVCRAEAFRDYCSACGGVCGACVTQSCSTKVPCAPGSVCGVERLPTGSVRRCRSLTVPESTTGRVPCTPRAGMCWLPSEVAYEPEDEESIYNRFCAR